MDLFIPMLGIGLVTSVHCVAMCGSMVLTYAVKDHVPNGSLPTRMAPHLAYQSAKIVSYVLVGLLLGTVGAVLNITGLRGWVTLLAGAFMILLGLNMTGRFPALRRLNLRPPRSLTNALVRLRKKASAESAAGGDATLATPVAFGLLTGFMPCAPLQTAQLAAAGAGSALAGAATMLGFGLGTMPLMLGFGAVSGALGARFKQRMTLVAAAVVMVLGLVMLNRGAMLVGSPVTFQAIEQAIVGAPAVPVDGASGYARGADGVAEVPLVIENTRFVPDALSIPADEPVRLVVDRREDDACSAQLAVPQLGVLADLKPFGRTVVELPAADDGAYTLTCGMGMMAGRLVVGAGAASPNLGPLATALLVVGGALVALWAFSRGPAASRAAGRAVGTKPAQRGGTKRRRGASGGKRAAQPRARQSGALLLGFTRDELLVGLTLVVGAVIAGLLLGGMARY